jgi:hypothetical protein
MVNRPVGGANVKLGEAQMSYTVTHGGTTGGVRPGPVGLDPGLNLEQALHMARGLLAEGKPNVAIIDGNGHEISGADLIACCNGKKTLSPDLRAN